ncbi:MAG: nicotinate-nucleotide diphosphorylase (carboxylating), partial [Planctomycetales bacterium]|nr:nicotinate-nucleotide diphosphorylase (carboxylating) [Planctomycetales bacterium]
VDPGEAVAAARAYLQAQGKGEAIVEIEVDTLEQMQIFLPHAPDIILLDNMPAAQLCAAVALRNAVNPAVQLDASGGVTIDTIGEIARTGVERISIGALTHAARWVDIGLDWLA